MHKHSNRKATSISERRNKHHWTQAHLAQVSGLDIRTIQRIEAGKISSFESLMALASAFNCNIEDIIDSEDPHKSKEKKKEIILAMPKINNGKELFNFIAEAHFFHFDYDNLQDLKENDIISNFLQYIQDTSEIWREIQISDRMQCTFECTKLIKEMEEMGFSVFGFRKEGLYSKNDDIPLEFQNSMDMGVIVIKRSNDPRIIKNLNNDGIDILPTILPTEFQSQF